MTDNIIYQGAEAKICKSKFMGFDVVEKRRISKSYRIKEIDSQLISYRTREEVKLISEARKNGVSVPIIFDVDQEKGIITMEYLKGKRIKDIFNKIGQEERADICKKIGINVGRLHKNNLIHGDITTSNMIYQEGKIHFIDFGLGEINSEIEAKGVDLHVLMEAIESAHSKFSNFFKYVLDGYKSEYMQDAGSVIKKIDEIVKRGRYR